MLETIITCSKSILEENSWPLVRRIWLIRVGNRRVVPRGLSRRLRKLSDERHGQRVVRVEPGISISSFIAARKRAAEFFLIMHVEQCAIGA